MWKLLIQKLHETGIIESQKAIDEFISQQKSGNKQEDGYTNMNMNSSTLYGS